MKHLAVQKKPVEKKEEKEQNEKKSVKPVEIKPTTTTPNKPAVNGTTPVKAGKKEQVDHKPAATAAIATPENIEDTKKVKYQDYWDVFKVTISC